MPRDLPRSLSLNHRLIGYQHLPDQSFVDDPQNPLNRQTRCKIAIHRVLDSISITIISILLALYALFADDVRMLAFDHEADLSFDALTLICMNCFLLELALSVYAKPGYLWSYYFWLDLMATISLIPDINTIWDPILDGNSSDIKNLGSAGKASRAGARTSRFLRIIRQIRVLRLVRLYKNAQAMRKENDAEILPEEEAVHIPVESKVGKMLTDLTTKRVILIVLVLLLCIPLFEADIYANNPNSWDFGVDLLEKFQGTSGFHQAYQKYIDYHEDDAYPLIKLYHNILGREFEWGEGDVTSFRLNEIHIAHAENFKAYIELTTESKLNAMLNICKTAFICLMFCIGALIFTKDANDIVITPIENMISKVKRIAYNPMLAAQKHVDIYEAIRNSRRCCLGKQRANEDHETKLIEDTIVKIGALLAIGFGEAGTAIIAQNMQKDGDLDLKSAGNIIIGIFGFCDVRNFTDSTEVLQEKVMVFINEVALIVHGISDKYQGAANKNIGDAFLVVWKLNESDIYFNGEAMQVKPDSVNARNLAELSLFTFMKIWAKVNSDQSLIKYRFHQELNARMPNYSVKMGFGLHIGWAIEGAIGSEYKIDASYLSPNVNITSRLEELTKQYGVPLLVSGDLISLMSPSVKQYCRQIDTIEIKGNAKPIEVFTADMDIDSLEGSHIRNKTRTSSTRLKVKKALTSGRKTPAMMFANSKLIRSMTNGLQPEFLEEFSQGLNLYTKGDWREARLYLMKALELKPADGPSKFLLDMLESQNFEAPKDWRGRRLVFVPRT